MRLLGLEFEEPGGLDEYILSNVWERNQYIEFMKIKTLAAAIINPEGADKALNTLLELMLPSCKDMGVKKAKDLYNKYKQVRGQVWNVTPIGSPVMDSSQASPLLRG